MKNLRIVSEGNKDVSVIDTFLLKRLLDCYKSNLISVDTSVLVDSHIDRLRMNRKDILTVIKLNKEFNDLQMFHSILMIADSEYRDFNDNIVEKNSEV